MSILPMTRLEVVNGERQKSLSNRVRRVPPLLVNLGLLAEGLKSREVHSRGYLLCPRKCSPSFGRFLRNRHPIRGKMDTPTLLNAPLDRPARSARSPRGRSTASRARAASARAGRCGPRIGCGHWLINWGCHAARCSKWRGMLLRSLPLQDDTNGQEGDHCLGRRESGH